MSNLCANNLIIAFKKQYNNCNVFVLKDRTTNRCYIIYDLSKVVSFDFGKQYHIFGKVNSSDKPYLVLNGFKEYNKNAVYHDNKDISFCRKMFMFLAASFLHQFLRRNHHD